VSSKSIALLTELQDWDAYYDLESAEERLADYRAEKEEEARKHKFWQDAREKAKSLLTPEEFEALGIR
jgi:hypothetical protein